MNTKIQNDIKTWLNYDNKIIKLKEEIALLTENKNIINNNILDYINSNNLDNCTINISDGKLKVVEIKHTSSLTFKFIKECLFDCINNEKQVDLIINYIKNKRDIKILKNIKRFRK